MRSKEKGGGNVSSRRLALMKHLPVGLAKISLIFSTSCSVSSPALHIKLAISTQKEVEFENGGEKCLPLVEVDLGDLEDEVGESSANSLDDSEGEHDLSLTVNVSILNSQNVSEFGCLSQHD